VGQAPGHLLMMVCDGALRFLASAEAHYLAGSRGAGSANVEQAQRILVEMMGALDRAVAPDMTDALSGLYQRVFDLLTEANRTCDAAMVGDARIILTGLRNAWADASVTARRPLGRLNIAPLTGAEKP
jgi:flagellar protein FliS